MGPSRTDQAKTSLDNATIAYDRQARSAQVAAEETTRLDQMKALGSVPEAVGPEIPEAPARGPVRMITLTSRTLQTDGTVHSIPTGYRGRNTLQRADSFDVMAARAARHKKSSPFSPGQVAMGRLYRNLVERHAAAGIKCSNLDQVLQRSSGVIHDGMGMHLRDRARLDLLRARIGTGTALIPRQKRTKRGKRSAISDRELVDRVCLQEATLSGVLKAHGWSVKADLITALQLALADALDRMIGPAVQHSISVVHFGEAPASIWEE